MCSKLEESVREHADEKNIVINAFINSLPTTWNSVYFFLYYSAVC